MARVAVIGGGPAGLIAARELARRGLEVSVFEEDREIGVPERCGGLLSLRGLSRISAPSPRNYILNLVRGAILHSPSRKLFKLDAGRDVAAVVSRELFDKSLAHEASRLGAEIVCGERILEVSRSYGRFILKSKDSGFKADWIIDAEGMTGKLAQAFLKKSTQPRKWLPIIQFTIRGHGADKRFVHLYFKDYLPDFFAYLIPIDDDLGRVGVSSRIRNLSRAARKFLMEEFQGAKAISRISHAIYVGEPMKIEIDRRFIPVGDAGGHVKATTGGGVIMGGLMAINVASAISEIELKGDNVRKYLERIDEVYQELRRIAKLRRLLEKVPPRLYDEIFPLMEASGIKDILKGADMDFQASSLVNLSRSPRRIVKLLPALLKITYIMLLGARLKA